MMMADPETRKTPDASEIKGQIHRIGDAANNAADKAANIEKQGADIAEDATRVAADAARHAASRGSEMISAGMRTMADASAPLADVGYDRGHRLVEATARVTDVYREASEETAADVQTLAATYSQLGQGFMRMQHAYFDVMQQSLLRAKRRPQDLLRCRSVTEFAEVQRKLYTENVAFALQSTTALIRLANDIVQTVVGPLETRARERGYE
jgi:hypothetical protein